MKIYHYTSLETFALIIKNRTFLFNNVKNMNDPEEVVTEDFKMSLQDYAFISCWTQNPEESIPLWQMYSDSAHGVRLESDTDFIKFDGSETNINGLNIVVQNVQNGEGCSENAKFILLRQRNGNGNCHYHQVRYSNGKRIFKEDISRNNIEQFKFNATEAFATKNRHWEFEEEIRFILLGSDCEDERMNDNWQYFYNKIIDKKKFSGNSVYLKLKDEFFKNLKVTSAPCMNKGEKILLTSLIRDFGLGEQIIQNSKLKLRR